MLDILIQLHRFLVPLFLLCYIQEVTNILFVCFLCVPVNCYDYTGPLTPFYVFFLHVHHIDVMILVKCNKV